MNEDENKNIPYLAFESVFIRFERINKRLWILCIILVIMLVSTNIAWIHYVQQFETVTTTIEATQDGSDVNIVGGGNVNYGAESTDNND